jgi:hydrogenase expression/formation protein HypE
MDRKEETARFEGATCPVPYSHTDTIVMGHGSGGRLSQDLIAHMFLPPFDNPALRAGDDAGVVRPGKAERLAISTDSHVVWPLFFPGGDIGRLAVCGTVNDVAMMGATPLYLTTGFILEEGVQIALIERVVASMKAAATEAGVQIVAGDTKVVQRGKADGLYITTTGVGLLENSATIGGAFARPGDLVILSGPIGDHGIAVLSARGDLGFEAEVESDIAPLNHLIATMLEAGKISHSESAIHVMRDPTRGGVATSLNEIARQSKVCITLDETTIPVRGPVAAACELLGFDPLYIANEGKLLAIVQKEFADKVLEAMKNARYGLEAVIIGEIQAAPQSRVLMRTVIGSTRVVDVMSGEMLPRIC